MSMPDLQWMNTKAGCLLLLFIPVAVTGGWLSFDAIAQRKEQIRLMSAEPTPIKQVDAQYHQLPYPEFTSLKSTYVASLPQPEKAPLVIDDDSTALTNTSVPKPTSDEVRESKDDQAAEQALKNLDLSKLSLSMKSKVEAAIKSEKRSEQAPEEDEDAMDLRRHEDQYQGILPALNFQTHVYTTDPTRRWVKINGVEYRQGDSVGADIVLIEIKPKSTIIRFKGDLIEIPALYEWRG